VFESSGGTRPVRVAGRDATEVAIARFTISVAAGPDAGHEALLGSTSVHVGTDAGCDLVLTDPTVSARHAMLTLTPEGVLVEDLGSRNGTLVDGTRVRSAFVGETAVLKLGDTALRVTPVQTRFVVLPDEDTTFCGLVARSRAMRDVFALVRQLARTDLPVAITGETGTGKELVARALHQAGPRRDRRFLVLDCGAILPELLRSELFGHEKGAFTGADRQVKGILEEAAGGTVFLDEVGEIDLSVQPNLLRALETREVCRVGSRAPVPVEFRVVSATNRDLRRRAREGEFRADLFYRLSCVTIRLPALRERPDDLPLLAQHFLTQCAERHGAAAPEVPGGVLERLAAYAWPGNLRELRNAMEALWALSEGRPLRESQVAQVLPPAEPEPPAGDLEAAERGVIADALAATGWNRKAAAKRLGIAPNTLLERIRRYGLKPPGA